MRVLSCLFLLQLLLLLIVFSLQVLELPLLLLLHLLSALIIRPLLIRLLTLLHLLLFYALAGGAVLYVIGEIWTGMRRYGHHTLGLYLIAAGFLVGVATDLIVSYGGG